jgi:hypothetical protein
MSTIIREMVMVIVIIYNGNRKMVMVIMGMVSTVRAL